jgi:hypothetical protein
LLSYGADILASFRHSAVFVDKSLKGAKPGDLLVEQPTPAADALQPPLRSRFQARLQPGVGLPAAYPGTS